MLAHEIIGKTALGIDLADEAALGLTTPGSDVSDRDRLQTWRQLQIHHRSRLCSAAPGPSCAASTAAFGHGWSSGRLAASPTSGCRASAEAAQGATYDLVLAFECIHDMADPVGALRAMRVMAGAHGAVVVMDERVGESFAARNAEYRVVHVRL